LSRYCARYRGFDLAADFAKAACRLDAYAKRHGIDLILPSDAATTRFLAAIQPMLSTPVFPVPDIAAFDVLATKDRFMALCRSMDIPHPEGAVFSSKADLAEAIAQGQFNFPAMLKPVNRAGSIGVVRIDPANAGETVARLDYAPILAQDFVDGVDRSISIFCRDGAILKQAIYDHPGGEFKFVKEPRLARIVARITHDLRLTGVFNFDARVDAEGRVWMIECNPRFFFNMDVAMVAGMNFADVTDISDRQVASLANCEIRAPQALLRMLRDYRLPRARDWKMLGHWLADPLMFALIAAGYDRRWSAPWLDGFFAACKAP
jgi:biotin carboxylase